MDPKVLLLQSMYMHRLGEGRVPRKISFQELHVRVGEIAAALKSFGVKKGDRIAGKNGCIHNVTILHTFPRISP